MRNSHSRFQIVHDPGQEGGHSRVDPGHVLRAAVLGADGHDAGDVPADKSEKISLQIQTLRVRGALPLVLLGHDQGAAAVAGARVAPLSAAGAHLTLVQLHAGVPRVQLRALFVLDHRQ